MKKPIYSTRGPPALYAAKSQGRRGDREQGLQGRENDRARRKSQS